MEPRVPIDLIMMVLFWSCLHYTQGYSDVLSGTILRLKTTYDHAWQWFPTTS